MTPEEIKDIYRELEQVKLKINEFEVQFRMMKPSDILQFKATVIQTLQTIDKDIDNICKDAKTIEKSVKEFNDELWKLKIKIVGLAASISAVGTLIFNKLMAIFGVG